MPVTFAIGEAFIRWLSLASSPIVVAILLFILYWISFKRSNGHVNLPLEMALLGLHLLTVLHGLSVSISVLPVMFNMIAKISACVSRIILLILGIIIVIRPFESRGVFFA